MRNNTTHMLSLPGDVLGIILGDMGSARAYAYTCTAALEAVKAVFSIRYDDTDIVIRSPVHSWSVLDSNSYVTPGEGPYSSLDEIFIDHNAEKFEQLLVENYEQLGLAVSGDGTFVYDLGFSEELSYFAQYLTLLGGIKCLWIGERNRTGYRIGKFYAEC